MTVYLDPEDATILRELVERRIDELGPEIHHTHSREYRAQLRVLREALQRLDERLAPGNVPAAVGTAQLRAD